METGQFQKFSPRKRVENRTISRIRALNIGNNKARDLSSKDTILAESAKKLTPRLKT